MSVKRASKRNGKGRCTVPRSTQKQGAEFLRAKQSILLVQLEFSTWERARSYSYPGHFAFEEGLVANNADCFILPALHEFPSSSHLSWLSYARELCAGKRFDQVWVWMVHNNYDEQFLEWIASLAPVRVAFLLDALDYLPEEYARFPHLRERRALVERHLRYMTHVLTVDECEAASFKDRLRVEAIWYPPMVPERFVSQRIDPAPNAYAVFAGALYSKERALYLAHPALQGLLVHPDLPENHTPWPRLFAELQREYAEYLRAGRPVNVPALTDYLSRLRQIRQAIFSLWLDGIRLGCASVNLPSLFKGYVGRVFESMAAGRPVISWEVADRPCSRALFEVDREILLFPKDDPAALAAQIRRIQCDPDFARDIAEKARAKILRYHTAEMRMGQVLRWIETGAEPDYGVERSLGLAGTATSQDNTPLQVSAETVQIRRADKPWSEQVTTYVREADAYLVQGNLQAAYDAIGRALAIAPDNAQLHLAHANLALRLGDIDAANREFVKAASLAPDYAPAQLNLALVLLRLGGVQEAETAVRRALALNPAYTDALKLLGWICFNGGRDAEGLEAYASALRQRPNDVEMLLVLGKYACETRDLETARIMYKRVLEIDNGNKTAQEGLAFVKSETSSPVHRGVMVPGDLQVSQRGEPSERQEGFSATSLIGSLRSGYKVPIVSVIVPTHNRPDTLMDCLRSILNQTYRDFEIIVVNDAGSDVENIVRFVDKDGRITYIRHGSNRDRAAARNTGIKVARGKYISYLDDDDLYYPDHLETLVTFLQQSGQKVAYTDAHRAHQEKRDGRYVVTKRDVPYFYDFDYDRILVHNYIPVLCVMHERVCLDTVGCFDESLTTHEDWDLLIRLSRRFQIGHIKRVTCEFVSRTDGSTTSSSKLPDFERTRAIILQRYKASATEKPHIRAAQEKLLQSMGVGAAIPNVATQPVWTAPVATFVQQADEYFKAGELQRARERLGRALEILPDDPQLILFLGNIVLRLGDVEGACREFAKAAVLHPDYAPAHADLAAVLLHLGRGVEAETSARQALELDAANVGALKVLAKVCLDTERYQEAVQAYATILRDNPNDLETLLTVGNCYAEAGRPEDAKTFYQRVLQLDPGNAVAAENLAVINGGASPVAHAPIASIAIVTYNSATTIRACLDSVLQRSRPPIELIVVDNASTDETRAILTEYQGRITVLLNAANKGFSRGCNQGIRLSAGDYVVLLNPDTVVTSGWLDRLIAHFKPDVGAVGPVSDYVAGLQKVGLYLPEQMPQGLSLAEAGELLGRVNAGKAVETKLLIGFCMVLSRKVLDEVGLLDEELFLGNDDLDLSWRLRQRGYRLLVATDAFVHHEGQVSFKSEPSATTARLVQDSTDRLYAKLETHYGKGNVPDPMELWGITWFKPSHLASCTSIIILTHNGLEHTEKCLTSIAAHTPEPHELIIVDNGSTDGTLEYLRNYMATHDNVRVIANRTNRGFAAGNNQGMALARGEYVLLLNNDTIVTEGWLRRMVAVLERHPEVGIVGPMSNYVSGPQLVKGVSYANPEELARFSARWATEHAAQSVPITRVVGFCLLARKQVIERIGGLDEQFGSGNFEDDDLCIRAAQVGYAARIAHDVFIHHIGSQTFRAAGIDYSKSLLRNWGLFKTKWGIPADAPYERGYRVPLQPPPGLRLRVPLPDLSVDYQTEAEGRWWQEVSKAAEAASRASSAAEPLSAVIVGNGHGLAPLWPSLVQHTHHPLTITILQSADNGNGSDPVDQPACPEDWQVRTGALPDVRLFNQLLASAHDDPMIVLSSNLILTPGWLKRLLAALKRDQRLAAVGPTSNQGATPQRVKAEYKGTGKALRQFALRRAHQYGEELAEVDSLAPFCIVFKPSACRPIGSLREDLDLLASLHDYVARLRQAGCTVGVALDTYVHCESSDPPS